jgi:hypothetical protein
MKTFINQTQTITSPPVKTGTKSQREKQQTTQHTTQPVVPIRTRKQESESPYNLLSKQSNYKSIKLQPHLQTISTRLNPNPHLQIDQATRKPEKQKTR